MDNPESRISFGSAIDALQEGKHIARAGWNEGVFLTRDTVVFIEINEGGQAPAGSHLIALNTPAGPVPWMPNQIDILARDWVIVD